MIKRFCDLCKKEITAANEIGPERLSVKIGQGENRMTLELTTAHNDIWNKGDFCKYCVLDAFNKLDDRPKPATE